jgi:hypothetical protein
MWLHSAQQVIHETGPRKATITNKVVLGIPSCCSIPDGGFSRSSMAASKTPLVGMSFEKHR